MSLKRIKTAKAISAIVCSKSFFSDTIILGVYPGRGQNIWERMFRKIGWIFNEADIKMKKRLNGQRRAAPPREQFSEMKWTKKAKTPFKKTIVIVAHGCVEVSWMLMRAQRK